MEKNEQDVEQLIADALAKKDEEFEQRTKDLQHKNTSLLNEVKSLKIKLKDFNPDEVQRLKDMAKEIEEKKREKDVEKDPDLVKKYEDRIAEMMEAHEKELAEAKSASEKLQSSYTQQITESVVLDELAKRKVSPRVMKNNILPHVETKVTEDGRFETIIRNPDGSQRFDPKTNKPFDVGMLLDEFSLQEEFAPNFPQASGGGAGDGPAGKVPANSVSKYSDLKTFEDKKAFIDKYGQEEMDKLIARG